MCTDDELVDDEEAYAFVGDEGVMQLNEDDADLRNIELMLSLFNKTWPTDFLQPEISLLVE